MEIFLSDASNELLHPPAPSAWLRSDLDSPPKAKAAKLLIVGSSILWSFWPETVNTAGHISTD